MIFIRRHRPAHTLFGTFFLDFDAVLFIGSWKYLMSSKILYTLGLYLSLAVTPHL